MARSETRVSLVGKWAAGLKELQTKLDGQTAGAQRQATLGEICGYFRHQNLALRSAILRTLVRMPEDSVHVGLRVLNDPDENVAGGAALMLGYLGRKTPDHQPGIAQALDAKRKTWSAGRLPDIYRALRYLEMDEAKTIMLEEHARIRSIDREAMQKLEVQMALARDDRFIEPIIARSSFTQLGGLNSPQALPYLISAEWVAGQIRRPEALSLALRFGFLDEPVFKILNDRPSEEAGAAVADLLNRLQIVTAEMLQAYLTAGASGAAQLVEEWEDRKMTFLKAMLPDEVVDKKQLPAILMGAADADRIDQALLFAALRRGDESNLTAKAELQPFATKDSQQMPGWFFFRRTAAFYSRFEQTCLQVRQLFSDEKAGQVVREKMMARAVVDFMAGQLETRDEEASEARFMLNGRWRAIVRLLQAPDAEVLLQHLRRDYPDFDAAGIAGWKENPNAVAALAHSKYSKFWKWGVLSAGVDAQSEVFLKSFSFAAKARGISAAARSTLRLYAYLLFSDPAKEAVREAEWRIAFDHILKMETQGRKTLQPFGMEIQSKGVAEERMAGMKQALEHFGIPSPRRPEFYGTVEAAYRPVFSAETLVFATELLEKLGLFEEDKDGDTSALHLSLEGDLGDEAKWIALPLNAFGKRKSKRAPAQTYESLKNVMSKGLIHLNSRNQHAGAGQKLTSDVHTEFRTARLQREGDALAPAYRDFMPAAQMLGTSALAYLKRQEGVQALSPLEVQLADLWADYRRAIREITSDDRFQAAKLMQLDWYESTGDANDASLVPHLAIIQERMAMAQHFEANTGLGPEFYDRVQTLFLDYGRRAGALTNSN